MRPEAAETWRRSVAGDQLLGHCGKKRTPVLGLPHLESPERETVAGDVLLRNGIPAPVLHRDPRFIPNGFETNFDAGGLIGCERRLAPGEGEPLAGRPGGDAADLEFLAAGQGRHQTLLAIE